MVRLLIHGALSLSSSYHMLKEAPYRMLMCNLGDTKGRHWEVGPVIEVTDIKALPAVSLHSSAKKFSNEA